MPVLCSECSKAFLDENGHCVRCKRITGDAELKAVDNLPADLESALTDPGERDTDDSNA